MTASNRPRGVLFLVLTALFALITYAALDAGQWPIVFAAAVLAVWLANMAVRSLRR